MYECVSLTIDLPQIPYSDGWAVRYQSNVDSGIFDVLGNKLTRKGTLVTPSFFNLEKVL